MTDQTKAPERIWVKDAAQGTERPNGVWDSWSHPSLVDFIRADLAAEQVKQAYERGLEDAANEWQNVRVEGAVAVAAVMAYSNRIRVLNSDEALNEEQMNEIHQSRFTESATLRPVSPGAEGNP